MNPVKYWPWAIALSGVAVAMGGCQMLPNPALFFSPASTAHMSTDQAAIAQTLVTQISEPSPYSLQYETRHFPHSLVHVVRIPPDAPVIVKPIVAAEGLEKVDILARQQGAIAAINGGFFDPQNAQTTSYVMADGAAVLDPTNNVGLMNNPRVALYLDRILNRSEVRRYYCGEGEAHHRRYAIVPRDQLPPIGCQTVDALGAGPALLPQFRAVEEAFLDRDTGRDAIGAYRRNARSGIGLTADGTMLFVMAAQRPDVDTPTGMSLPELSAIMTELGVTQGMNLDGGSSSTLYYDGTAYYGRLDAEGNTIRRSVKSILVVVPEEHTD